MMLEKLPTLAQQVHLLRHFPDPGATFLGALAGEAGIPVEQLRHQCATPGSKFRPAFADNPVALCDRLADKGAYISTIWRQGAGKTDWVLKFDPAAWPQGIGWEAVMPMDALDAGQTAGLQVVQREGHPIQVLAVEKHPETWQMVAIVDKNTELITAFPGRWLPPADQLDFREWVFLI